MEMNLQKRVAGLKDKIPEIQKTLDTVGFLKLRRVRFCVTVGWRPPCWWDHCLVEY
jgi:hypothetical protein